MERDSTALKLFAVYVREAEDWRRPHLGASKIGEMCERKLYYSFRWAVAPEYGKGKNFDHPGQTLRLFERGQREEDWVAADLRKAGITLHTLDPKTGKQFRISHFGGHFAGSLDGIGFGFPEAPGTLALWECKTANQSTFNAIVKHGVREKKEEHYAQMQTYMGSEGIKLAIYTVVCKNTDRIHVELVTFDESYYRSVLAKAKRVVFAKKPPRQVKESRTGWPCNLCEARSVCREGAAVSEKHCRTCSFSSAKDDGSWWCSHHKEELSLTDQKYGCQDHQFRPEFAGNYQEIDFR